MGVSSMLRPVRPPIKKRNSVMTIRIGTGLLVALTLVSRPLFAEQMTIDKQVRLSPGHPVEPYHILRASNGDVVIFGSIGEVDYRAWATRITPGGEVRWDFLQEGPDGWNDRSENGQRYDSAVELPDQSVLLCGIKTVNWQRSVLLDRIGVDGRLINERVMRPGSSKGSITDFQCIRWNDGIALFGGVAGAPRGTGWLAILDEQLNLKSEKFDDQYVAIVMADAGGGLFLLNSFLPNPDGSRTSVIKLSPTGEVMARHALSDNDNPYLVHPVVPRSDVRVALFQDTLKTTVIDLDDQLRGPTRAIKLHNAGVKKCLELADGSIAIFGSQFHNVASAAVTRVYKDGSSKAFPVEPAIGSPWYFDAVLTGNPAQFAAVRIANFNEAVLDWISFK
jgi:hypothetical protein